MKIITYPDIQKMINNGEKILLIDLRDYEEYARHHIDDSINIPEEKFIQMMDEEDKMFNEITCMYREGYNIILYCMRGNISMIIAEKMGMHEIETFSLYGGINEYDKYVRYEKSV